MAITEIDWSGLMRAANGGDASAYHTLLRALTPYIRRIAARGCRELGAVDVEDVLQDTLLALHANRHTWDAARPLLPWVKAITRNKIRDAIRRNRIAGIPIDELEDTLVEKPRTDCTQSELARMLARLKTRQREIVAAISIEGLTARQAGARLGMSEGAVRVAYHRSLHALVRSVAASPAVHDARGDLSR
ncbi:MAG: sigma-70 family RNA polymerase sigma factor [Hyphomicrobiaceae bacterium]|nr:sigma-70 family RNA polymerase sigma factor [Hyphomicrobiaceae bacterium]